MSCRVGVLTCRDLAMGIVAAPLRVASPVRVFHVAVTLAADQSGTVHRFLRVRLRGFGCGFCLGFVCA
jgi:hypothetical protein